MPSAESEPPTEPKQWTVGGFLSEVGRVHKQQANRAFAFILGAGVSVTSGIPTGGTLARRWVEDLYKLEVGDGGTPPIDEWAKGANLGEGFCLEDVATFYASIYDRRFGDDPDRGYADLEHVMSRAEPSVGYSVLAQVLEQTRHKVVITTNFDNLVADALAIYSDTFPLVCGHESLAGFARPSLRRPLVAKIHRDLLLAPKSGADGVSKLGEQWAGVLSRLLEEYTPIVLGYGGNDGSLMGFLEELPEGHIPGGIFWCFRRADGQPNDRIRALVARHRGRLIPILGFDEFMIQLGQTLELPLLDKKLAAFARKTVDRLRGSSVPGGAHASAGSSSVAPTGTSPPVAAGPHEYEVALSFAGEQRSYVRQVTALLKRAGVKVFYDKDEDLWGKDLATELERVYRSGSRYVVVFVSREYLSKSWTNHERQHALAGRIERQDDSVLPVKCDDSELPGLPSSIGYLSVAEVTPEEIVERIVHKLRSGDA